MMNSLQFTRSTQAFLTHLKPLMKERSDLILSAAKR
jgi:hypothetical protein